MSGSGSVGLNNAPLSLSLLICKMGAHEQVPLHRAVAQLRECAKVPAGDRHTVGAWEPLVGGVKMGSKAPTGDRHTVGAWEPLVGGVKMGRSLRQPPSQMQPGISQTS